MGPGGFAPLIFTDPIRAWSPALRWREDDHIALAIDRRNAQVSPMPSVALQAHFDGKRIVLDEPFDLPAHTALLVTVLPPTAEAEPVSEQDWLRAAAGNDALAFLADPADDIYTAADGEPIRDAV
jgi:hypothetical protein